MSTMGRGGGGGGFGDFPYRSAHQQGTDGRGRSGRGRRAAKTKNNEQAAPLIYGADVYIMADRRGRLIGRGGVTIKELTTHTGAHIHVPKPDQRGDVDPRPVYVKAATIASLLHACWRVAQLGLEEDEKAVCKVRLPDVPQQQQLLQGHLVGRCQPPFLTLEHGMTTAYCIETTLLPDQVDTLVDNERFANSTVTAAYETVVVPHPCAATNHDDDTITTTTTTTLAFVYGKPEDRPEQLYQSLLRSTTTTIDLHSSVS
jgi:KH domain